jgi:hypothetical protein
MAIRGTAVQTEISAVSGTTKFSLLTEPNGAVGSFHLLEKRNLSQVITSVSDPGVATIVASAGPSDVRVTQISKTPGDIRNEAEFFQDIFQVFSLQPRQRRGSSDFDGVQPLPINTEQFFDDPDPPLNAVTPFFPQFIDARPSIPLSPDISPVTIQGATTEDGAFARLNAVSESPGPATGVAASVVDVPASLPLGVVYVGSARTFTLDPSHPAYQHLGRRRNCNCHSPLRPLAGWCSNACVGDMDDYWAKRCSNRQGRPLRQHRREWKKRPCRAGQ